jgi:hypothetical protein
MGADAALHLPASCPPTADPPAAGPWLSDAAAASHDALLLLLRAVLLLEQAGDWISDVDRLIEESASAHHDWPALLQELYELATDVQRIADTYGHREVGRRFYHGGAQ